MTISGTRLSNDGRNNINNIQWNKHLKKAVLLDLLSNFFFCEYRRLYKFSRIIGYRTHTHIHKPVASLEVVLVRSHSDKGNHSRLRRVDQWWRNLARKSDSSQWAPNKPCCYWHYMYRYSNLRTIGLYSLSDLLLTSPFLS